MVRHIIPSMLTSITVNKFRDYFAPFFLEDGQWASKYNLQTTNHNTMVQRKFDQIIESGVQKRESMLLGPTIKNTPFYEK